jgi:glycosyltransferase involved in cell wall biosynthesis
LIPKDAPIRIAFVTPEYVTERNYSGGLANYVHRLSLSLVRMGHRPLVVVSSDRDESFVRDGVEIHRVRVTALGPWMGILNRLTLGRYYSVLYLLRRSLRLCACVKEIHRREPVSVVQYPHLGGVGIFRPRRIPSVVRLSSYTPLWKLFGEYDAMEPSVLRGQERLEDWGLRRADAVFGPCKAVAAVVEKDIGRPVAVIETPFLMDTPDVDGTVYRELLRDKDYLLFVGRFSPAKGFITIADAIPALFEKFPRLFLAVVGREQGGYKGAPAMEYLWEKAGRYRGRILSLGDMRHELLYPIMANARAVVIPSLVENFPNVCLEAMAHRRVVIGTRGTAFEQLLEDGASGLLCEPGDPASLVEAVEKALRLSDGEREKMGERAAERIRALRPEIVVEQLLSFYRDVMDRTGAGKGGKA